MVRSFAAAAGVLAFMGVAASAQAQSAFEPTPYATIGYTSFDAKDSGVNVGAITGRAGVQLHPNFATEGELSFGVQDDDVREQGVDVNIKHRFDIAAYGVAILPLGDRAQLFARVGFGHTEIEAKASAAGAAASVSLDGKSWNYGVGGQYFLDDKNGVRLDWTRRDFTEDQGEVDVYSINYVRRF